MRLKSLKLKNFQGIKKLELNFDGKSAAIYGDNATGKTTVFNAVTWLLFDKASTGAKGFTPKTKNADGDAHNLNHTATVEFILENGEILALGKDYHEVYKKKKGSPAKEFSGHTIDYFVNGIPVKEKEYLAAISGVCDAEQLKILTMPHYFAETMTWEARRKLLLEICGEVNDEEILSKPEFEELTELLKTPGTSEKRYTIDEFKKIAAGRKTAINKELAEIPGRIDEANRSLYGTTDKTEEQLNAEIAEHQKKLDALQIEYDEHLQGDDGSAELTKKISAEKVRLEEIKGRYAQEEAEKNAAVRKKESDIETLIAKKHADLQSTELNCNIKTDEIHQLKKMREELINKYSEVQKKTFDKSNTICPVCGREYPPEKTEEMIAEFNANKSRILTELNERGKKTASKDMIEKLQAEIDKYTEDAERMTANIAELHECLSAVRDNIAVYPPVEETEEYKSCTAAITALREQKENLSVNRSQQYKEIVDKMRSVRDHIEKLQGEKVNLAFAESVHKRINELKDKESELAREYEKLEKTLYLCDLFIKEKVSSLTDKINDKFKTVSFRLFSEQINGGIKEECEVLVPAGDGRMVPFAFANNAARINAGLEIINTLSEYWDVNMPVFIDNAESVTKLIETGIQTIRLVVSEPDKSLRLELSE